VAFDEICCLMGGLLTEETIMNDKQLVYLLDNPSLLDQLSGNVEKLIQTTLGLGHTTIEACLLICGSVADLCSLDLQDSGTVG